MIVTAKIVAAMIVAVGMAAARVGVALFFLQLKRRDCGRRGLSQLRPAIDAAWSLS